MNICRVVSFSALLGLMPFYVFGEPIFSEGEPHLVHSEEARPPSSFSPLVKVVSSAVVNVSVESDTSSEVSGDEAPIPSLPGHPAPRKEPGSPVRSLGTGFIITADGYIVTNNHVIEKSKKIIVRLLNDKNEYVAKPIGVDSKTDLALLKIEPKTKLNIAYFGDSDSLEVGDWLIAIGNQFQLGQTVTAGIVSATSRRVPTGSPYDAFIQTDASINPGSSGGPLFNVKGQVVGINTAIFSPGRAQFGGSGFNIGIGFAIPINLAKTILRQLKDDGKVTRGLLGVMIQKIDNDMASALGLPSPGGALVSDIIPGTPAANAGFERGDVIIRYNGHPVNDHDELPLMVANTPVGASVPLVVIRKGKEVTLSAVINELKDAKKRTREVLAVPDRLGLTVASTPEDRADLAKKGESVGVLVDSVEPGSPAEEAGVVRGDIILELNGTPVANTDRYRQIIKAMKIEVPILILLKKAEGTRYLTARIHAR